MLQPGVSCGRCPACLAGRDNECPQVRGARLPPLARRLREFVKVPVQNLIAIPDGIGYVDAAAFPLTFLTAWHMLVTKAQVAKGEEVLVLAAGSGVGQAAIQVARLHGARVIATAGSEDNARTGPSAGGVGGHPPPQAGHRRRDQAPDEQARCRCRHRTC